MSQRICLALIESTVNLGVFIVAANIGACIANRYCQQEMEKCGCISLIISMALSSALIVACTYVDSKKLLGDELICTYVCLSASFILGLTSSIATWHFFPKKPARAEVPLEF